MENSKWILCPRCGNKTKTKYYKETILCNFPLYCPKCRTEFNIKFKNEKIVQSQTTNAEQN